MIDRRKLAKQVPYCMGCKKGNPDSNLICLAHSNQLKDGRGFAHKSLDECGAYLCHECHDYVDGRKGGWSESMKNAYFNMAAKRSREWEKENIDVL
jgi:hypothetical protein